MKPKEILHDHQMSRAHSRVYAAVVAAAFSAALLMAGCAVGPEYQPPVVELNALRAQARHLSASDAAPIERWWEGFHDPLLNRLVQDGLARNLDLAVAAARVSQARAYLDQSQAALLPSIEADGSAASQRLSLNSAAGRAAPSARRTHSEYSAGLQASWELDLFGSLRRQAGAASALADEAGASQAAVQISVAADIADAYLSIRGLQQEIGSARGEVGAAERLLDLVQRRISAGASNDLELAQSQALLYQARASLPPSGRRWTRNSIG
ncbi:TolC family protein [Roseateles chitinivorans]|uniref:TolC family protein n=1 Tax=Roseateles chitinivorans TaxID=2917965 RepID=UPI003D6727A9